MKGMKHMEAEKTQNLKFKTRNFMSLMFFLVKFLKPIAPPLPRVLI